MTYGSWSDMFVFVLAFVIAVGCSTAALVILLRECIKQHRQRQTSKRGEVQR